MAHAQTSPAKGKTPVSPKKKTAAKAPPPAPAAFPTPDELRAFFFLLRDLGWKPGAAHPCVPPRNDPPPKGTRLPTKAQLQAVFAMAHEMGWRDLNDNEIDLINHLRQTTYKGRNHVYEAAAAMRRHRPWILGGDIDHNTAV